MKVLFVSSESYPFIKTGGLGDVAYALPKALKSIGVDVKIIIPKYLQIPEFYKEQMDPVDMFSVSVGWRNQYCGVHHLEFDNLDFYFVDNEYYFKRENAYGYFDDAERFSFFSRATIEFIKRMNFLPDIIHVNDWHSSLVPAYLKMEDCIHLDKEKIKTVITIHNLKYQGRFSKDVLQDVAGLPEYMMNPDGIEFYGDVNFMKAGLNYADYITTVSPSYADEIKTTYFGEKLDGVLNKRSDKFEGILNGIDYQIYSPSSDKNIFENYDIDSIEKKSINKLELQKILGLPQDESIMMIGMVTRLVSQKGLDLVAHVMKEILDLNVQFVLLGTGDEKYHNTFHYYSITYPQKCSVKLVFDNTLAQRIYAASDLFLMPSEFEPCGIGQLISLRYGTLPLVRETGGLKDTIIPYDKNKLTGNGFSFANYNAHEMLHVIEYALSIYNDKKTWNKLVKNAMKMDFSWENSAKEYLRVYKSLLEEN